MGFLYFTIIQSQYFFINVINLFNTQALSKFNKQRWVKWLFIAKTTVANKVLHENIFLNLLNCFAISQVAHMLQNHRTNGNAWVNTISSCFAVTHLRQIGADQQIPWLSLIHISEPTRLGMI